MLSGQHDTHHHLKHLDHQKDQNTQKVKQNVDFNQTIQNNANFQRKHLFQVTNKQIIH